MSAPAPVDTSCCAPATAEGIYTLGTQIANTRGDLLTADAATRGALLSAGSGNTQSILTDANGNATTLLAKSCADTASIVAAVERGTYNGVNETGKFGLANISATRDVGDKVWQSATATQSQGDKFGLANLNATRDASDKVAGYVDRAAYGLGQEIQDTKDKVTGQATTIAWAQDNAEGRRFGESRAQVERINDAQSAFSDRAFKYQGHQISDSFARLSAQGETGFYRTREGINQVDRDVLKSEISLSKDIGAGFANTNLGVQNSYARLSEQHCDLKSAIAAAQAAAAECCCEVKQEVLRTGKELGLQAAGNFGAIQVEAAKNTAAIQLQAAANQKESLLEQSKWFALAEKTAMVNKCELADKLAACCCEVKELVSGSASATQALIQATEATRVRDALAAAATENAILKLRREEPHHPHPYPYPQPYPYPFPFPGHHHGSRRNSRSS